MFQGRIIIVWLTWLIAGICGVFILLIVICYCRLMPRHQKSFDEQYLKDNYAIKENQEYSHHHRDSYRQIKHAEVHVSRSGRPASYAGDREAERRAPPPHCRPPDAREHAVQYASSGNDFVAAYINLPGGSGRLLVCSAYLPGDVRDVKTQLLVGCDANAHHTSWGSTNINDRVLDELDGAGSMDALKTRSLPAFLRPKPRPLSTEDDLHQLYAKVNMSKKYKNRMRSEHAAIIALSKSRSQALHADADAVIVLDQRTAL